MIEPFLDRPVFIFKYLFSVLIFLPFHKLDLLIIDLNLKLEVIGFIFFNSYIYYINFLFKIVILYPFLKLNIISSNENFDKFNKTGAYTIVLFSII
jgi:hypothetical protein